MAYPGIYKALDGTIYYYLNESNFFSPERNRWEEDCDNDDHKTDVNITREYLTNTYGKVESREHADFLIKLAGKNKIELGIGGYSENKNYFYFTEDEDLLYLVFTSFYPSNKHTSITLPLPPKDEAKYDQQMVGAAAIATLSNIGYTYHGGELWKPPLGEAIKESGEWPAVGDEVVCKHYENRATVVCRKGDFLWVESQTGIENYTTWRASEVKKPPTPEDELESKIRGMIEFTNYNPKAIAEYIINGEIKGLSYKPE